MSEPEQPAGAGEPQQPQQPWMPPVAPGGAGGMPPPMPPPIAQVPGPPPPGPAPGQPPKSRKWQLVAAVVVVLAIAGAVDGYFATRSGNPPASAANASLTASGAFGASGQSGQSAPAGRHRFRGVAGTIAAINGNTITLNTQTGVAKVQTTASTAVTVTSSGRVGDIATGDRVIVSGTRSGTTIAADNISDVGKHTQGRPVGGPGRRNHLGLRRFRNGNGNGGPNGPSANGRSFAVGTVTAVNGSTLTLKTAKGTTETVTTTSSTNVTITKAGSLSDLKPGDQIVAIGNTSNGVTTATRIAEGRMGIVFGRGADGGADGGPGPFRPLPGGGQGGADGSGGN